MLDLKLIREQPEAVVAGLQAKGISADIDRILALDTEKRELQTRVEAVAAKKNVASATIAEQSTADRQRLLTELKELDRGSDPDRQRLQAVDTLLHDLLWALPNLPTADVKIGKDESANEVVRSWGTPPTFSFAPKASWEIGPRLGVFDTERAAKVSGTRFGYLTGPGAKIEFALLRFAMETLEREGFIPVIPPALIGAKAMDAMGYTMHGGTDETYYFERDDQYLVGTAEQSLGPMHRDEVFEAADLPRRYAGFSPCFRREAGSSGKDTRGIFRVHQFDKVEMFSFTTPEQADAEHEVLLGLEERFLQALELPYQVVKMCTGDLGVPAARKYDLEAWFPSENRYRELTSTSTCTDWQARRLNIRYRQKKTPGVFFVHTLNGTAFSMNRPICAILENHQQADGSVVIPKALQSFVGVDRIVPSP
ncbi:serine--tRNA ligase [Candidatus Uhrbacteria bacterium]|nr:serine--tRNA ligase [Candidatus Uhrbacteria bacterium]